MKRLYVESRPDKAEKLESIGLSFHGWDDYWNEEVAYKFTAKQVDDLEDVTNELHAMCLKAVKHVIDTRRFAELGIPQTYWDAITKSFEQDDFTLYGRFDFAYDGVNPPKMLEYNADTPTSLLESAVAQWYWMEDKFPDADQFNSLHDKLVARWKALDPKYHTIHFASISENEEDWVCVHYLMETAIQAGRIARHIYVEDIGYDDKKQAFVDVNGDEILAMFKLYPWEWLMREDFGQHITTSKTLFIEPMWKSILSNKGILAILWELFPDHPNLLPAYFDASKLTSYAKKPFFSREGANIELIQDGKQVASDEGPYGAEGHVYQQLVDLPVFEGCYPVIGSWIVGDESAGICIREDVLKITTNMSNFIPHYFTEK